jgi:hypothetical protein
MPKANPPLRNKQSGFLDGNIQYAEDARNNDRASNSALSLINLLLF